jgi:hypothetical protein
MAEISQYNFTLKELTIALVKQLGIHDGSWMVGFEFTMGAGNLATSPTDVRPTAIVGLGSVLLLRVKEGEQPVPFQVDAAEINPEKK